MNNYTNNGTALLKQFDTPLTTAVKLPASELLTANTTARNSRASGFGENVVFIDTALPDYQTLVAGVAAQDQVVLLNPQTDEIAQISNFLSQNQGLQSIQLVSHGSSGAVQLGSEQLSLDNLKSYQSQVSGWGKALQAGGDILLWGCDVAEGRRGVNFVQQLQQLTGAQLAASTDLTGSAQLGGNWNLEYQTGKIAANFAFDAASMRAYHHLLATYTVNTISDSGAGSLRAAISQAKAAGDIINFDPTVFNSQKTITLSTGVLTITDNGLTINGPGQNLLSVSGNKASQVFSISSGGNVTINGLTITGGSISGNGGGIVVNSGCTINLNNSTVSGNTATGGAPSGGFGGGIENLGTATLTNSTVSGNSATIGGSGIVNLGTATLTNSTVSGNTAKYGGGIDNFGTATLTNSTVSGNTAPKGGGIYNLLSATLTNSTVSGNSAATRGGGIYNLSGKTVNVQNTIIASNTGNTTSPDVSGTFTDQGNNLIGKTNGSTGFTKTSDLTGTIATPLDPKLGTLQNNGGPTQTQALLAGSPAIGAGNKTNAPLIDQRGYFRIINNTIDIGAYESNSSPYYQLKLSGFPTTTSVGQSGSFSVSAVDAFGQPYDLGTVKFTSTDSNANLPASYAFVTADNGTHVFNATLNSAGSWAITVTDTTNSVITAQESNITVKKGNTQISGNATPNNPVLGQSITLSANVTVQSPSQGTPTGTVQFIDSSNNNMVVGNGTLNSNGTANVTISNLSVGSHNIIESYLGDGNFSASNSTVFNETVSQATTTTTGTASPSPAIYGQNITLSANVTAAGTPTGNVSFVIDGGNAVNEPLTNGVATYNLTTPLSSGNHTITETYLGDSNFANSNTTVTEQVNPATTTTTGTASASTTVYGQNITFNATVAAVTPGMGTPTGNVTFTDGSSNLGTVTLSNGTATLANISLSAGNHTITETYSGDSNFLGNSTTISENITQATTSITGNSTNASSSFGQAVSFSATVSSSSGTPTGNITFADGNNVLGSVNLSNGSASLSVSNLTVGNHTITETYSGDSNFASSNTTINETISQASTPTPTPTLATATLSYADELQFLVTEGKNLVNLIFDNNYYLAHNPDVAAAVAKGQFSSGLDHFLKFGEFEGRNPSIVFDNQLYLSENPDVAAAVAKGQVKSGVQHFLNFGLPEHRYLPMLAFDEGYYLANNPDVKAAVANGTFASGFAHYLDYGQQEGRSPSPFFSNSDYLTNNPDVATAVQQGQFRSSFDQFIHYGIYEGRNPSANVTNQQYLSQYASVNSLISQGVVKSGIQYALQSGDYNGQTLTPQVFDESYYLANNPDVAAAVAASQFSSGFDHFILYGQQEGRAPSRNYSESYYLANNPDVATAVQQGKFHSGFEHYIEYGISEGRVAVG